MTSVHPAPNPLRALWEHPQQRAVLRPADVGGAGSWQALVREGHLRVLRPGLGCAPGLVLDAPLRASLLVGSVPRGTVVTGRTAAWVHTGCADDGALDLVYPAGHHRPWAPPGARLWQGPLLHPDTVRTGGLPVTSPVRTVVELALRDPAAVERVVALVRHAGADLRRATQSLEARSRAVGRPRAREVLAAAAAAVAGDAS